MKKKQTDPFLFFVVTLWIFAIAVFVLNMVGYVPYYVSGEAPTTSDTFVREYFTNQPGGSSTPADDTDTLSHPTNGSLPSVTRVPADVPFLPEKIVIPRLGKELTVVNPVKKDVETLDRELLEAVVRYPDSALLNQEGNIFIFGHSSHLRTVHNPLFKAFNGIEKLPVGSLIQVMGGGQVFVYHVDKIAKVSADTALVDLTAQPGKRLLTLSTCDSFGAKTDRYVVTASFSVSYPIPAAQTNSTLE